MCDCRSYWPSQAYYQPQPYYYYDPQSSSRALRNQAEKQRRDKMNHSISELAHLVPTVRSSSKKLDKTSILRLSATYLRAHYLLLEDSKKSLPRSMCEFLKVVFDTMEGMLVVVTSSGKIVFVTENVEQYLGHHQNDLLGSSLIDITHAEDQEKLKRNLKPDNGEDSLKMDADGWRRAERRSFLLRLKQRAASKSDQPQYETVQVEGHLRCPRTHQPQGKSKTHTFERYLKAHLPVTNGYHDGKGDISSQSNDIVLVALVTPYKEKTVSSNAVLEATKEEWFTRHLLNGTIVFADHRISILCGYMSEEVSGEPGFKFMHKDDVRWVMIALRQMFTNGDSSGWSAYRLQIKNGDYIYLRTQGYLELEEGTQNAKSFICVNTLLDQQEGKTLIAKMKMMFTPIVKNKGVPLVPPPEKCVEMTPSPKKADSSVDSVALQPLETSEPQELGMAIDLMFSNLNQVIAQVPPPDKRDEDYTKVEIVSKSLPPIEVQSKKIGAKLPTLIEKYNRPSVITSITGSGERPKRPPDTAETGHPTEVKRLRSESRSVIISDKISVIKRNEPDNYDLDENFIFNADLLFSSGNSSFSQISGVGILCKVPPPFFNFWSYIQFLPQSFGPSSRLKGISLLKDEESIRLPDEVNSSELWDSSVSDLEEGVLQSHLHLENRIQSQGVQIDEIEEDLETVPNSGSNHYRTHITTLKAEHRKQQEMLKTLQHNHKNIHKI